MSLPEAFYYLLDTKEEFYCSISTLYRIFKKRGLNGKRNQCRAPRRSSKPTTYAATAPDQVWSWDITYFRSRHYSGQFYYAYVLVDIYSRRVMHSKVYDADNAKYACEFLSEALKAYKIKPGQLVLHSDNGPSMKANETLSLLKTFGVQSSYSRPRVSNDNPYSESLFKTLKYNGFFLYPQGGFESITQAQRWLGRFVDFYNLRHRHRGIRMVTPDDRYSGRDVRILEKRKTIIEKARKTHPQRWISGKTMNLEPAGAVYLNPENLPLVA